MSIDLEFKSFIFQYNGLLMEDHNLLAILPLESDSDSDSYGDTSTLPIAQSEEVVFDQDLFDSVCWKDRVRRLGKDFQLGVGEVRVRVLVPYGENLKSLVLR